MPAPTPIDWTDPAVRQMFLDATGCADYVGPNIQLSKPGLPQNFHKWTMADRHAYQWLLDKSGDPRGIAYAFDMPWTRCGLTADDVLEMVRAAAEDIQETFPKLQRIVGSHEALIRSRWGKKTESLRTKLLKKAWPELSPTRRPDLRWLRTELDRIDPRQSMDMLRSFDAPHLTVEALVKGNALLHLLNSRVRNEPSAFVLMDLEAIEVARRRKFMSIDFMPHRVDLSSPVSSGRFGAIKEDFTRADLEAICGHRAWGLSDAHHVMRIQSSILQILDACCEVILHDQNLDDANIPMQPEPGPLPALVDDAVWAIQRPFRVPQTVVDFRSMTRQAEAVLEQAREHVWLLRDDPVHFETTLREHMDHGYHFIKDSQGLTDELVADLKEDPNPLASFSALDMISENYNFVLIWETILSLLEAAQAHQPSFVQSGAAVYVEDSPEYFTALMRLRVAFDEFILYNATRILAKNLTTNPSMRHRFERTGLGSDIISTKDGDWASDDPLLWLIFQGFEQVRANDMIVPAVPLDDVLVEVHRLVEEKAKVLKRPMSSLALKSIADACFLADLRCQLTSLCPRIFSPFRGLGFEKTISDVDLEASEGSYWAWLLDNTKLGMAARLKSWLESDTFPNFGELANPNGNRFRYPVHQKRTRENTKTLQDAEKNLDEFWERFDQAIKASRPQGESMNKHFKTWWGSKTKTRTPDWVAPITPSRLPRPVVSPRIANQLANLNLNGLDRPQGRTAVLQEANSKKEKVKTRGVADPARAEQDAANQQQQQPAAQPAAPPAAPPAPPRVVFQVSHRSMRVIRMLFHHPGDHNQSGDVDWTDFLHAMAEVGFSAAKLYGSVWNLAPTGDKLASRPGARDIRIHEPHPGSRLKFRKARQFGGRVAEVFEIDAGCFEEK